MKCSICKTEFEGIHKSDAGAICDECAEDIMSDCNGWEDIEN